MSSPSHTLHFPAARSTAAPRRRVAVLGLDYFARKNLAQLQQLEALGYAFDVFVNRGDVATGVVPPAPHRLHVAQGGAAARVSQVWRFLRRQRASLHHVEVYPGGRFAAVYVLLARCAGVPVMVVERGDLINLALYDGVRVRSMKLAYRLADVVWYRELYQEGMLRAFGARRLFFLHNAVPMPAEAPAPAHARDVDFLWVNRLTLERKSGWIVDALRRDDFQGTRTVITGFLPADQADAATRENQAYAQAHAGPHVELLSYADPHALYRRARFFLLPADAVFCNNALLEAMAAGVVPLVSDVEGARRIVDHGVDGFVIPHSQDAFAAAMRDALAIPARDLNAMSQAAVAKVRRDFSLEWWRDQLAGAYDTLGSGHHGSRR